MGPDLPDGSQREDLYVFQATSVSLKKGERMVLPITKFELPYEDLYTLRIPLVHLWNCSSRSTPINSARWLNCSRPPRPFIKPG